MIIVNTLSGKITFEIIQDSFTCLCVGELKGGSTLSPRLLL